MLLAERVLGELGKLDSVTICPFTDVVKMAKFVEAIDRVVLSVSSHGQPQSSVRRSGWELMVVMWMAVLRSGVTESR